MPLWNLVFVLLFSIASVFAAEPSSEVKDTPPTDSAGKAGAGGSAGAADPNALRFSIGLFVNTGERLVFDSVNASNGAQVATGDATIYTQSSTGIGFEARQSAPNHFGWSLGASLDSIRELEAIQISAANLTYAGVFAGQKPLLWFLTTQGNVIYRWDMVYIPLGLNINLPRLIRGPGPGESVSVKGALGLQLGVGFYLTEAFAVELLSRATRFRMTYDNLANHYDLGSGYMSSIHLNGKFLF